MNNILMNTDMTKAILDGRKTQFRIPFQLPFDDNITEFIYNSNGGDWGAWDGDEYITNVIPKYRLNDIIFAQEEFCQDDNLNVTYIDDIDGYIEDDLISACDMREIHARIFLKVTNVRVERVQDMTYSDLRKEGVWHESCDTRMPLSQQRWNTWKALWNKTATKGYKCEDNPRVFVYEFERVEK